MARNPALEGKCDNWRCGEDVSDLDYCPLKN